MNGLRSSGTLRPGLGLLLGVLLALGPMMESLAATQGPCGQTSGQPAAPIETTSVVAETNGETQWTCPDRASTSTLRALPSERPDGPDHDGADASFDGDTTPSAWGQERTTAGPTPPFISSIPAFLRVTVLQI